MDARSHPSFLKNKQKYSVHTFDLKEDEGGGGAIGRGGNGKCQCLSF